MSVLQVPSARSAVVGPARPKRPHQLVENANLSDRTGDVPSGWAKAGTGAGTYVDRGGYFELTYTHSTFQGTYLYNSVVVVPGRIYTAFLYVISITQAADANFFAAVDTSGTDGSIVGSFVTTEGWYAVGFKMGATDALATLRMGSSLTGTSSGTLVCSRPGIVHGLLPGVGVNSPKLLARVPLGRWIGTNDGNEPLYP